MLELPYNHFPLRSDDKAASCAHGVRQRMFKTSPIIINAPSLPLPCFYGIHYVKSIQQRPYGASPFINVGELYKNVLIKYRGMSE